MEAPILFVLVQSMFYLDVVESLKSELIVERKDKLQSDLNYLYETSSKQVPWYELLSLIFIELFHAPRDWICESFFGLLTSYPTGLSRPVVLTELQEKVRIELVKMRE